MLKYLVNTPKGGVGKTTISTNLALFLASKKSRVWALDLAQGSFMSQYLSESPMFQENGTCKIDTREGDRLPTSFAGSKAFDYMVVDTDDDYQHIVNVLDQLKVGWRLISPVPPDDYHALDRVPYDLSLLKAAAMLKDSNIPFKVVANKVTAPEQIQKLKVELEKKGIVSHLCKHYIPCLEGHPRYFYQNSDFSKALTDVLKELG